ncbi:GmrSD restriction endonuclease domain-containing protein [Fictibacillus enclensis]|uniref:GmrSD restriction endonuclease domain-containing protein n=1 Tax=Fictibacillus enclensis TaxID=1017270 RepID=UPI0024C0203F|nr:DUF262 domain-containing protein [Fictibacillus enclensis]WHY72871.1 DUF262 domain-containing protein [Fictibacillus enclensis]
MSNYNVNNSTVESIISWIKNKMIAIPEIQRPFVWDATKVRDLLDSLYKNYPVGYIITWQNPDTKLKDGSVSSGKKILIDGQQRITALTAAITGQEIIDSNYKKKRIRIAFNPIEEKFEVRNPAILKNSRWIHDISEVFSPEFNLFTYINEYCERNPEIKQDELNRILQKLQQIKYSSIGMIELSHNLDIETVTEIFIRINSKGVVLSQADFAMSKITVNESYQGPNIRKTIDYFCHLIKNPSDYDNIKNNDSDFSSSASFNRIKWVKDYNSSIYEPSYSDLLRVAFTYKFLRGKISNLVSLLSGRDFETREYKEEITEASFSKLNDGVLQFIDQTNFKRFIMIVKSAGIISPKLIRSKNAINFAYTLFLLLRDKNLEGNKINHIVRKWLVLSILTERYSGSPETMFEFDIRRFNIHGNPENYLNNVEEGELSEAYWTNILVNNLDTSVTSSPYFNLYVMSQIYGNDNAFLSKSVKVSHLIEERGDIHHIFPKKYLQKCGIKNRGKYNQIANYVYTEQIVNLAINQKAPNIYMGQVREQCELNTTSKIGEITNKQELEINLEVNCIPISIFTMDFTNFDEFLLIRRRLMAQKIRNYYKSL